MKHLIFILLIFVELIANSTVYYISPTGNDTSGDGSIGNPYFELEKAWSYVSAGDTIYCRGGTYEYDGHQILNSGVDGSEGNYINVFAYPNETPLMTKGTEYVSNTQFIYVSGSDYLYFKGLEISGVTQVSGQQAFSSFFFTDCNYCIWENINYHHNSSPAVLRGTSTENLILNCDFHHNYDPYGDSPFDGSVNPYDDADGLNVSYITYGSINTVRGCRFFYNSDDGIDAWDNDGNLIIENCWFWHNGYKEDGTTTGGNGCGIKLGKTNDDYSSQFLRTIRNCITFNNRTYGISQNGAICKMYIFNNTVYENLASGIYFRFEWSNCENIYKNNLAYNNSVSDVDISTNTNKIDEFNNWNGIVTVTDTDFASIDSTGVSGARQPDGSLPELNFLRLASSSDLIDAGVYVGLNFNGTAPDLGAFEYGSTPAGTLRLLRNTNTGKIINIR